MGAPGRPARQWTGFRMATPGSAMTRKIYIIGAGAIGSLVGGRLVKAFGPGAVTLIDVDEEHVRAVRDKGLRIFDKGQPDPHLEALTVDITTPDTIDKHALDRVILATKAYSNNAALEGLRRDIPLLVLQNGYDERLREFSNAVSGVEFGFACGVREPGYIFNAVRGRYVLGVSDGIRPRVTEWAGLLNKAGVTARAAAAIDGWLWSKLLINSALNPVSAIAGCSFRELIDRPPSRRLFKALYIEGYPIVKRKTKELKQKLASFLGPPSAVNWILRRPVLADLVLNGVAAKFGEVESSMLQDVRRNRPTEIDYLNGAIVRLAAGYGIATPENDRICEEVRNLERRSSTHAAV